MVGKQRIAEFLHEIYEADLSITLADEVIGEDRIDFSVDCALSDDGHIFEDVIAHLRDGKVVCQVDAEAWDR